MCTVKTKYNDLKKCLNLLLFKLGIEFIYTNIYLFISTYTEVEIHLWNESIFTKKCTTLHSNTVDIFHAAYFPIKKVFLGKNFFYIYKREDKSYFPCLSIGIIWTLIYEYDIFPVEFLLMSRLTHSSGQYIKAVENFLYRRFPEHMQV